MSLVRIDRHPTRRQLQVFAILWLVFFAAAGSYMLIRGRPWGLAGGAWITALVVPVYGALSPGFMRKLYVGMAYLTFPIGFALSHVILAVVYFLVITPTGLVLRTMGYDSMNRSFDESATSYWIPRKSDESINRYFRQF